MAKIIPSADVKWGFPLRGVNQEVPSRYLNMVLLDHFIAPGIAFHDSLVEIAKGHRNHPKGNHYACYGSWIGRGVVTLFYPLATTDTSSILDYQTALSSNHELSEAKRLSDLFESTLISQDTHLLEYIPALSHLSQKEEQTPLEYIYHASINMNKESDSTFAEAKELLLTFLKTAQDEYHWVTYQDIQRKVLHCFIPMRKFGAMDKWPSFLELLKKTSTEEAKRLKDARRVCYNAIQQMNTYLLTFVPSCDNSGCEFVE